MPVLRYRRSNHYCIIYETVNSATRYVSGFVVWLRFDDGKEGVVDLAGELTGPIFAPLRDANYFSQVKLRPELRTLVWPNGADFAHKFLRSRLRAVA